LRTTDHLGGAIVEALMIFHHLASAVLGVIGFEFREQAEPPLITIRAAGNRRVLRRPSGGLQHQRLELRAQKSGAVSEATIADAYEAGKVEPRLGDLVRH